MKHISWLARSAIVIWLAWLGLIVLLFAMLKPNVWHPHFPPATALLGALLTAALAHARSRQADRWNCLPAGARKPYKGGRPFVLTR